MPTEDKNKQWINLEMETMSSWREDHSFGPGTAEEE